MCMVPGDLVVMGHLRNWLEAATEQGGSATPHQVLTQKKGRVMSLKDSVFTAMSSGVHYHMKSRERSFAGKEDYTI